MSLVVELSNVAVDRGRTRILSDINLEVPRSQVLGVSGPNGSGKTTLLRTISTLMPITAGVVSLFGEEDPTRMRTRIGMIGHKPYLIPHLTIGENLGHLCRLAGFDPGKGERALDIVGLGGAVTRKASAASFGMVRRVEVALQMVTKPELLLLDEAVAGLDAEARDLIGSITNSTTKRGGAVVTVSHDRSHLEVATDRVVNLINGKLEDPR